MKEAIRDTRLYKYRFIHVARKFGVLPKETIDINIERLANTLRDTPLDKEVIREILTEKNRPKAPHTTNKRGEAGQGSRKGREGRAIHTNRPTHHRPSRQGRRSRPGHTNNHNTTTTKEENRREGSHTTLPKLRMAHNNEGKVHPRANQMPKMRNEANSRVKVRRRPTTGIPNSQEDKEKTKTNQRGTGEVAGNDPISPSRTTIRQKGSNSHGSTRSRTTNSTEESPAKGEDRGRTLPTNTRSRTAIPKDKTILERVIIPKPTKKKLIKERANDTSAQ